MQSGVLYEKLNINLAESEMWIIYSVYNDFLGEDH